MNQVRISDGLEGKVVVVTGGAGMLGQAFCSAIASAGGVAVVADVLLGRAQVVADTICSAQPGGAVAAELDITDRESVRRAIEDVHQRFGSIGAVVNNAYPRNKNYGRVLEDVTYDDFCQNVGMHAGGYFLVMQQFAKYFQSQGHGNIVNISSIYGAMPPRFDVYAGTDMTMPVEYAVIKAGVLHLTKYFAQYLKGSNIRVNAISPGGIFNNQPATFLEKYKSYCGDKGMLGEADVVGALMFLLSDSSQYINGQNVVVDDGFSL